MPSSRFHLINRDFTRLWTGQAVSTVGDYVFDTTLTLWVATEVARGKPWAPVAVSGVLLSVGAAVLLVGPLAGVFVDRWNRKRTMLRSELVRGGLVAALLLFSLAHGLPVGLRLAGIYLAVFALNAAGQFFAPARFATVGAVVAGEADRARAAGIGQATTGAASIIGPPLAAPLLFTVGVQWAMALNALSYLFSYLAIRSVRVPASEASAGAAPRVWRELGSGLRFYAGHRLLVVLLAVSVITQIGMGAVNTLNVFFVTGQLHATSGEYGFISMAFGAGSILGALLAGRAVGLVGARSAVWLGLVLTGVLVFGYSRQSSLLTGVLLLTLAAVPAAVLNTAVSPLILGSTPSEYLGRVIAVFNPASQLAGMVSVAAAGWLAATGLAGFHGELAGLHFGPVDTVFAVSGLLVVLAGCYAAVALPRRSG
ncbi:MFS transporter [Kitasatospora sp. NPDC002227]|uniref:MFS transporter n=1 Tax=Kitasatospora sp. NPDC002227 TaxID=3154773 RepID=UPI00332030B4